MEGGGAATCHLANPIRTSFYASGEVRGVSWLKAEGDLGALSTLQLQILVSFCSISPFPSTRQADLPWYTRDRRPQGLIGVRGERAFCVQPGLPGGCGSCGGGRSLEGRRRSLAQSTQRQTSLGSRWRVSMDTVRSTNRPNIERSLPSTHLSLGIARTQGEPLLGPLDRVLVAHLPGDRKYRSFSRLQSDAVSM